MSSQSTKNSNPSPTGRSLTRRAFPKAPLRRRTANSHLRDPALSDDFFTAMDDAIDAFWEEEALAATTARYSFKGLPPTPSVQTSERETQGTPRNLTNTSSGVSDFAASQNYNKKGKGPELNRNAAAGNIVGNQTFFSAEESDTEETDQAPEIGRSPPADFSTPTAGDETPANAETRLAEGSAAASTGRPPLRKKKSWWNRYRLKQKQDEKDGEGAATA